MAPQRVREAANDVGKPRQRGAPALKLLLHATCAAHTAPLRARTGSRTVATRRRRQAQVQAAAATSACAPNLAPRCGGREADEQRLTADAHRSGPRTVQRRARRVRPEHSRSTLAPAAHRGTRPAARQPPRAGRALAARPCCRRARPPAQLLQPAPAAPAPPPAAPARPRRPSACSSARAAGSSRAPAARASGTCARTRGGGDERAKVPSPGDLAAPPRHPARLLLPTHRIGGGALAGEPPCGRALRAPSSTLCGRSGSN